MVTSAIVDFHVSWRAGQAEELRAMHIHQGAAGANGPVVVNSDLGAQPAATGGVIFRQTKVMDAEVVEEIMANPGGFYVNIHSVSSGRGIVRGQLRMDASSELKKAKAELIKMGDSAFPFLEENQDHKDPEVKMTIKDILEGK